MTSIATAGKRRNTKTMLDILSYSRSAASRTTVRRYYIRWREENGLPIRCDMVECVFYSTPLSWLGKELPLILDHVNGNKFDNRPKNLRYLCPNCDSQLSTRGGKNRGKVLIVDGGSYVLSGKNGSKDLFIIAKSGTAIASGAVATIRNEPGNT